MNKFAAVTAVALTVIYLAGDAGRQNAKINAFLEHIENGYGSINDKLKDAKVIDGLLVLRKLYGVIAIAAFALFFVFPKVIGPSVQVAGLLSTAGLTSIFAWLSIKWCLSHKKAAAEFGSQVALLVFGPLVLGIADLVLKTPFTQALVEPLHRMPPPFGIMIPHFTNPLAIGVMFSLVFACVTAALYVVMWVAALPTTAASVALVLLPVVFARFIHLFAPRKAFMGFAIVLAVIATYWAAYA